MEPFRFRAGSSPLLVSMPHVGTHIPPALLARLTPAARALPDTDWHLEQLYDFLGALDASVLVATHSRYVIDLNRPPDDAELYPGHDTTGLIPVDTFAKEPLYARNDAPGEAEIEARRAEIWHPYHARLAAELARIRAAHGYVLLWDAHSILSRVPRFFAGRLPDFNLGTVGGAACGAGLGERLLAIAARAKGYRAVLNGRFKGGYITRCYGDPGENVHAVQLELSEVTYMEEHAPFRFRADLAKTIRPHLREMLEEMLDWGTKL